MNPSNLSAPDDLPQREQTARLQQLIGAEALDRLARKKVVVLGLGGVGSWCAEALVRSGIKHIELIDPDTVALSNINRQLPATLETVGQLKVQAMIARLQTLSADAEIVGHPIFWNSNDSLDLRRFDAVVDCIDTLSSKVNLALAAHAAGIPLYSSMGAGRKLDPTQIRTGSIWKTDGCRLAREMRVRLRKLKFGGDYLAVYSSEPPVGEEFSPPVDPQEGPRKRIPGSAVHVTAAFGMALAGLVITDRQIG